MLSLAGVGDAQVLPRLGDNVARPTAIPAGELDPEALLGTGARPAIADLGFSGENASDRRFAIAWLELRLEDGSFDNLISLYAAIVDANGTPVAGPQRIAVHSGDAGVIPSNPAIAVDGRNYFTVTWTVTERVGTSFDFDQRLIARTFWWFEDTNPVDALCPADGIAVFDPWPFSPETVIVDTSLMPELTDVTGGSERHGGPGEVNIDIDADAGAAGRTVIVFPDHRAVPNWGIFAASTTLEVFETPQGVDPCEFRAAQLVPTDSAVLIAGDAEWRAAPRVAVNANNEFSAVTWRSRDGAIQAQVLTPDGQLQGDRIEVAAQPSTVQTSLHAPDVDFGPDGLFRVVWERNRYFDSSDGTPAASDILMSRYDLQEGAAETNVIINTERGGSTSQQLISKRFPAVAATDRDGDAAVVWQRSATQCPLDDWRLSLTPISQDCEAVQEGRTELAAGGSTCSFTLETTGAGSACRAGFRIAPHPATPDTSWAKFAPDRAIDWAEFGDRRSVALEIEGLPLFRNRCLVVEATGQTAPKRLVVEQRCSTLIFDGPCETCEEQLLQRGLSDLEHGPAPASAIATGEAPAPRGAAPESGIVLRWLQRDYRAPEATLVAPVAVSETGRDPGRPGLGMGRDGDMLVGWIDAFEQPDSLVTQNLAGPVELRINDVGILEGPLTRATANFTLTANKAYPVRPGECLDAPVPSVELLTADGTASFQSGDYSRTNSILAFTDSCGETGALSLPFSVPVEDDTVFEGTENFFVNAFNEKNAIVTRRQGNGAIVDNDPPATVVFADEDGITICEDGAIPAPEGTEPRCEEGENDGPGFVEIRVRLTNGQGQVQSQEVEGLVEFQTFDGTPVGNIDGALAGADYEAVTGELQFLPLVTEAFLSINLEDDGEAELDERFFVELIESENLTLPTGTTGLQLGVTIIDDDICEALPQWQLPDPNVDPSVPPLGTDEERTGYFCVTNPEGFDACPWRSELVLDGPEAPWLTLTDLRFADNPANPDIIAAQAACQQVAGATGAIRYLAASNEPSGVNPIVQSRNQTVAFLNGKRPPDTRVVEQTGGDCEPVLAPVQLEFFPAGGEAEITVSFDADPACNFIEWTARAEDSWVSLDGADASGEVSSGGPGSFRLVVEPFENNPGIQAQRIATVDVSGSDLVVIQEAPLFDHFDDETPPDPLGWQYNEPNAWSETGTHLTASTPGQARIIANPAFPGCSLCLLETTVRIDSFGKGQATVYMWWRDEGDHLRLVADEFFDTWTLVQRIAGVDHVLREFNADILVGEEYPVRMEYRDDFGGPLITVDVGGQAMCPTPGPGVQPCTPWDPDPDDVDVPPVIGSGTVGLGAAATTASFNLLRVIRADELRLVLDGLFIDGFEAVE